MLPRPSTFHNLVYSTHRVFRNKSYPDSITVLCQSFSFAANNDKPLPIYPLHHQIIIDSAARHMPGTGSQVVGNPLIATANGSDVNHVQITPVLSSVWKGGLEDERDSLAAVASPALQYNQSQIRCALCNVRFRLYLEESGVPKLAP